MMGLRISFPWAGWLSLFSSVLSHVAAFHYAKQRTLDQMQIPDHPVLYWNTPSPPLIKHN